MKTAVIIGSTGLVGSLLLEKLAFEAGFQQIIAVCRQKPKDLSIFSNPRVRVITFNFLNWSELELQVKSFIGTSNSSFFCCLGTTIGQAKSEEAFRKVDHDYVVEFSKLAKSCKAEQLLVVSALGADKNSTVFYNKVKGETEADVQSQYAGKVHFLRPSLLLGDRRDFRFGERVAILLSPVFSPLMFGPLEKYKPVLASDVAACLFNVASKKTPASVIIDNNEIMKLAHVREV
jgi:uncharacterized protein YbjT (DUF2867 family)